MQFNSKCDLLESLGFNRSAKQVELNSKIKVCVGMSGGVDSSVVALILKYLGYDVFAMFMKNWEEVDQDGVCPAELDYLDVQKVCDKLDIAYYSLNFVKEYRENVFQYFLDEYQKGYTPNPDILCNREIKFKVFYQQAIRLKADYLATGHYCQIGYDSDEIYLKKAFDQNKDQTYFVYTIKADILKQVMFPIGGIAKPSVRLIADKYQLATSHKKDSTGICFIGEKNFKPFLNKYIKSTKGDFVDLDGNVVGQHDGHPFYTIGQRKGLGLGGAGEAWFVVGKDVSRNYVIVTRGSDHAALYANELWANEISWVGSAPRLPLSCFAKIRYRQQEQPCIVDIDQSGLLHVRFDSEQRAITIRQSVVFYLADRCLGGAVIERVGASLYQRQLNQKPNQSENQ
jgi:tRNA-specific 2-thiouridylase